jgi:uncharacterized protein (TIGR02145 family)
LGGSCQDDDTDGVSKLDAISYGTVTDRAGNVYKTLKIGNQTWLAENYRYRLADVTAAEQVTYGEAYNEEERQILSGTNMTAYANFCRNHYGQRFLLYLRERLLVDFQAGKLNTKSSYGVMWIIGQLGNYTIPVLMSYQMHNDIKDQLLTIWNEAVDYYFQVDREYLDKFGYLYSYEGALRAVKEGAPEGFHLPTDAEWMVFERALGMQEDELEDLEDWRGVAGDLLKPGERGIGFDALYGGAAVYAVSTAYNSQYVGKDEGAYFWCSDQIFVSDSLSNGMVRNISFYHSGIRRMTSRLITSPTKVRPSYSVRLVKNED